MKKYIADYKAGCPVEVDADPTEKPPFRGYRHAAREQMAWEMLCE